MGIHRLAGMCAPPLTAALLQECVDLVLAERGKPDQFFFHPREICALNITAKPPAERPRDYDDWGGGGGLAVWRPLKCVVCGIRLSRNSPRLWGNPYCGPHWP